MKYLMIGIFVELKRYNITTVLIVEPSHTAALTKMVVLKLFTIDACLAFR